MEQQIKEPAPMTFATIIKDFAAYNLWANQTYVHWLMEKPSDLMVREVASSFASIKETLVHIWDTQRFWLSVIQKTEAPVSFRMAGFAGTLEEVFSGIVDHSEEFNAYVQSLSDAELLESVSFYSPWAEGTRSRAEYIHHCMIHSAYHRGQVVTIGRNVGITDAPMTDYNFYLLYGNK